MSLSRKQFIKLTGYLAVISSLSAREQETLVTTPALPESGMPFLTTSPQGTIYMSWIDPAKEGHALRFSRWNGKIWEKPETIATGRGWFVNWADAPSISALDDGSFLAHWLSKSDEKNKYGYGIRVSRRNPDTHQWQEIHGMSLDEKEDYAGFLNFVPNQPSAIYLSPPVNPESSHASHGAAADAHHTHDHSHIHHRKTVRFISFKKDGSFSVDDEIDASACSCCPTSIARTEKGLIAAYRDRLPGEIRDISVIRLVNGKWTAPVSVHQDNWEINGCPTEGPSIATSQANVGIAWLTRADSKPRVQVAFSTNNGESFGSPVRIDEGNPLGRPSLISIDARTYLSLWLEKTDDPDSVLIRLRRIDVTGKTYPAITIAKAPAGRAVGIPRLATDKKQLVVAWRNGRIQTAVLPVSQIL